MKSSLRGSICGIGAALSYGLNPLGALPLYELGVNTNTMLFFRYGLAFVILSIIMTMRRMDFKVSLHELMILVPLGILFSLSSLTLFISFKYMGAGIACTLLFVYPVIVAILMAIFFKERLTKITLLSMSMALVGIWLLYDGKDGTKLNSFGILMVMASALSYAIYIIVVNKSNVRMSSTKLTFYVLLFSAFVIIFFSVIGGKSNHIIMLTTGGMWIHAIVLAVFPTVVSLLLMVIAIHDIGSTPTAIMGALEPVTAVIIGVTLFGEALSSRLMLGMVLILVAVILIIIGKALSAEMIMNVIGKFGHVLVKHWRWK